MAFTAKYAGRCSQCTEVIAEGDLLEWLDEGVAVHADCVPDDLVEKPERPTCSTCWQIVSVTGACGCDDS